MWSLICLQLLVAAAGQVHGGMKFSLTAKTGTVCGEVHCVDDASNGDSIKNLTIRMQLDTDVVLAEMNQQQPSFTSTPEFVTKRGIHVNGGLWESRRAEIWVNLFETDDCNNAGFICEIGYVTKLGVERVSYSYGRIDGKLRPKIGELSSSVANIETKLEQLTKSVTKILSKLEGHTGTIKEVKTQHLATCPRGASASPDNRYQVVYPTDGGLSYLCDNDGGWTVIQRRIDGKTDFYRNWYNYTYGFGTFGGDFWLGLERIHQISSSSKHELNITMEYNGKLYYAHYDNFIVSREEYNYRLFVGAYTGTAGDSLSYNSNKPFSTYDKENDNRSGSPHCAEDRQGAWWYWDCTYVNLNGKWGAGDKKGPEWRKLTNEAPATMTEMRIRKMI